MNSLPRSASTIGAFQLTGDRDQLGMRVGATRARQYRHLLRAIENLCRSVERRLRTPTFLHA